MNGAGTASTAPGPALRRFAVRLRRRHVLGRVVGSALRWSLLLAVLAVPVAWWLPSLRTAALVGSALVLAPLVAWAGLTAWWRGRRILAALQQGLRVDGGGEPDRAVAVLRDELATWFELEAAALPAGAAAGMHDWLARDVRARLAPHERRALAVATRPRLGRWRALVPLVLLLLLVWWIAEWLAPPWAGAVGGAPDTPTAGAGPAPGAGPGGGGEQAGDDGGRDEDPGREAERPERGDAEPPPVGQSPRAGDGPELDDPTEPAPLLDRPNDRRFVLPDFVGDGPTRRARMHAAEVLERPVGDDGGGGGAAGSATDEPPPTSQDFERAAEAALRARHVPPAERAMVRRFFERLRERGAEGR